MRVTRIVVLAVDNSKTGNAMFKSRIDLEGLNSFEADLTHAHLNAYANNGCYIVLRILSLGNWIEIPLNLVADSMSNVEDFRKSNSYGNS